MKIAIYGKPFENALNKEVPQLMKTLADHGIEIAIYERYAQFLRDNGLLTLPCATYTREEVEIASFTFLLSVGGDGTLLDTVTIVGNSGIPVIGLNAGRLGFISSIAITEFEAILKSIMDNTYHSDLRSLLQVHTSSGLFGAFNYALNEVTIHKKDTASMIQIETYLDDEFMNTYWADGLIVATPTGSTAYSLSCGGPIIVPGSQNLVITPIAPHNLNVRPVVVSNASKISLRIRGRSDNFLIALDSRSESITPEEEIVITKAGFTYNLLQAPGQTFLNNMRNKLGWGLDKRNK